MDQSPLWVLCPCLGDRLIVRLEILIVGLPGQLDGYVLVAIILGALRNLRQSWRVLGVELNLQAAIVCVEAVTQLRMRS